MSKLLALFLLLSCSVAQAEWTPISKTEWNGFYLDFSRAQWMSKDVIRVWVLTENRKLKQWQDYLSDVRLEEFDCHQRQVRMLTSSDYNGAMGTGTIIRTIKGTSEWDFVVPNTAGETLLNTACAIK